MRLNEKILKQIKSTNQMTKSFLKSSKSDVNLLKKPKNSSSIEKQKFQMSKNDQRLTIYCDKQGFIVEYSVLSHSLKCECSISQGGSKKINKIGKPQNSLIKTNQIKKKIKLQITINKNHLAIIKGGVEHIFSLPIDTKNDFLKVVLTENWQLQQFHIPNKKIKIVDGQILSTSLNNCDQIFPLKNIVEADQMRKCKLLKSDSKVKISWGNTQKDSDNPKYQSQILSFTVSKKQKEINRSLIFESKKQNQNAAFLRKSFNQCDQTRDSQEEPQIEEKVKLEELTLDSNRPKALSINFDLWNHTPKKEPSQNFDMKLKKEDLQKKQFFPTFQRQFK